MSACISQQGEYSDHEPGDYCPRCGDFNTAAVIHERDTAVKDRDDWQEEAQRLSNILDSIRELLDTETDERGITWWEWIDGGLGGDLHTQLRTLLDPCFATPQRLADPIPYRGALGLRTLDDDTTARILAQIGDPS